MAGIDYINESYFAVLGLTGVGKSSFLNAISDSDSCIIGNFGKSCTQTNQLVSFVFNNHRFNAIDTPGLDDSDNDDEKVNALKKVLKDHPTIKKIILVKKFNDLRLPGSMQKALTVFMDAFPLKTFWDHVIVVNSWANPHDESFTDYIDEGKHENFCNKIIECEYLLNAMKKKNINRPIELKEYFVCSKKVKKYKELQEIFNTIKEEIKSSPLMFKKVEKSDILERSIESQKNKGFYIVTKYKIITCTDFDDKKTQFEMILEEKEVAPTSCKVNKTEEESEFMEKDEVRWYDVATLGIARIIRDTKKYQVYKVNYYQVGDKEVKGERTYDRIEFR